MVARPPKPLGSTDSAENKPDHQRPEHMAFWEKRFAEGTTPWDAGEVPAALKTFAAEAQPRHALIPGCGSAYEAAFLDRMGWRVTALDFAPAAIEAARRQMPGFSGTLVCADFFAFAPAAQIQMIYERAFLCALPRKLWPAWGQRVAELLPPGGLLAGVFFLNGEALRGPPFGISEATLGELLSPAFQCLSKTPSLDAIGPFRGHEHWMVWERTEAAPCPT